jgi:hypothetical protein
MDSLPQPDAGSLAQYDKAVLNPRLVILGSVLAVALLLLLGILWRNGGQFAYTLDAPYTHLTLAQNILQGSYGLNPGEPASPSSSILYPFLLAALSLLHLGQYPALLVALASTLAAAVLAYAVAEEAGIEVERISTPQLVLLTIAATLAFNLVGLAFTGLEHSLHAALTIASLLGLMRFARTRQADWWWLATIALLPLIRFEAAAALAADMLVLALFGKWRHALVVGAIGALGILCFGLFLNTLGLPFLPSSVLSRSEVANSGIGLAQVGPVELVRAIYSAFRGNIMAYGGTHILLLVVVTVWGMARGAIPSRFGERAWTKPVAVGFFAAIALAQMFGGSLSSFSRYEVYVLALGACVALVAWQPEVNGFLRRMDWRRCLGVCAALLVLFAGYVFRTVDAISAAGNVHDQQLQLHRFVVDHWRRPYAANHPGWVNFDNPYYMLELSGLGSEEARRGAATPGSTAWMETLAARQGVGVAMLYDNALPLPPPSWRPVAKLRLRARVVTVVGPVVTFYATAPEEVAPIRAALTELAPRLPRGAILEMLPEAR